MFLLDNTILNYIRANGPCYPYEFTLSIGPVDFDEAIYIRRAFRAPKRSDRLIVDGAGRYHLKG
jgi:hypothetical protein